MPSHTCHPDRPCSGVFVCAACRQLVGWCLGQADEQVQVCDECAYPSFTVRADVDLILSHGRDSIRD